MVNAVEKYLMIFQERIVYYMHVATLRFLIDVMEKFSTVSAEEIETEEKISPGSQSFSRYASEEIISMLQTIVHGTRTTCSLPNFKQTVLG